MTQEWSEYVNQNFYGEDGSYEENRESVEYKSGRTIYYLKNSLPAKTHAVNLRLNDAKGEKVGGKTEFEWFLYWYEYVIKSGAEPFVLSDVTGSGEEKEYYLQDAPSWSGQKLKEINLTLKEA